MHITRRRRRAQTMGVEMTKGRRRSSRRERQVTTTSSSRTMVEGMLSLRHRLDFILLLLGPEPHFLMAAKWNTLTTQACILEWVDGQLISKRI